MNLTEKLKDIDEHWKVIFSSFFLIFITGVVPSIYFNCWEWFGRSGALLVCYGVIIAWQDYKGKIDKDIEQLKLIIDERFKDKADDFKQALDVFNNNTQRYFNKIEFVVVVVGTLIWGYGDLVGKIYS